MEQNMEKSMEQNKEGGSLEKGLYSQMTCSQKQPREAGQGERPKKGSGTTVENSDNTRKKEVDY